MSYRTSSFVALFDACVLYSPGLTSMAIDLARTGLYRARWTARIHEEWMRAACTIRDRREARCGARGFFFRHAASLDVYAVIEAVRATRQRRQNPAYTPDEMLEEMRTSWEMTTTADMLMPYTKFL